MKNGLYNVDEGRYFVQLPPGTDARVENYLNQKVLVVNASGTANYQIIW
jgi:hypothetical protein